MRLSMPAERLLASHPTATLHPTRHNVPHTPPPPAPVPPRLSPGAHLVDEPVPDQLLCEQGARVVWLQATRQLSVRLVVQTQKQHQLPSGRYGQATARGGRGVWARRGWGGHRTDPRVDGHGVNSPPGSDELRTDAKFRRFETLHKKKLSIG